MDPVRVINYDEVTTVLSIFCDFKLCQNS